MVRYINIQLVRHVCKFCQDNFIYKDYISISVFDHGNEWTYFVDSNALAEICRGSYFYNFQVIAEKEQCQLSFLQE